MRLVAFIKNSKIFLERTG